MTNVVVGCTGAIGSAVLNTYREANEAVIGVSRSTSGKHCDLIDYRQIDIQNSFQVRSNVVPGSTVIHCANVCFSEREEKLTPMLDGLLAGTKGRDIHIVYMDNYFGYGNQETLSELSEYKPNSKRGIVGAFLAQRLQNYSKSENERVSIVRAGDVYGPRVRNAVFGERSYDQILMGKAADFPLHIHNEHCFSYVKDVASALKLVADKPSDALFKVWHVPHAGEVSLEKLVEHGAAAANSQSKAIKMPRPLHAMKSLLSPAFAEIEDMQYAFDNAINVATSEFDKHFKFEPTPHDQAMIETMSWAMDKNKEYQG